MGVAALSLGVLVVCWWFGPYGARPTAPWANADWFYWIWSAFFAVVLILALLGAMHTEDWIIPTGRPLAIRVEHFAGTDDQPVFPFQVKLVDAAGKNRVIALQRHDSVDQFLQALRTVLTLDVDDGRNKARL